MRRRISLSIFSIQFSCRRWMKSSCTRCCTQHQSITLTDNVWSMEKRSWLLFSSEYIGGSAFCHMYLYDVVISLLSLCVDWTQIMRSKHSSNARSENKNRCAHTAHTKKTLISFWYLINSIYITVAEWIKKSIWLRGPKLDLMSHEWMCFISYCPYYTVFMWSCVWSTNC